MSFTNRGRFYLLGLIRGGTLKTNYFIALVTSATPPTVDINTLGEMTEITAGNGYTAGGIQIDPNATDFDTLVEDDGNDRAETQIIDIVWTAASGPIPSAGGDARYAVLTDDNGTVGSREVYAFWDLSTGRQISDTQTLTLQDLELRLTLT